MDNWMQLGRPEADFKDARSGAQSFGDSPGFFMQTLDEAPNRLSSFNNQFEDQGSARHFSDPYFFIHAQPSLTFESSTKMHTETNELHFWNGQNTVYGKPRDQPLGFRFEQNPSSWLNQPFARAEQPRAVRPHASVAPVEFEKTREGSGFKIFGFKVDTTSAPYNQLSSPMAATHEPMLQTQPSASLSQLQPAQTDCFPEVSVSTARTATENEKSIQQAPQCSKDVQSKFQGASTRSFTKVHKQGVALGRSVDLSKFNDYDELKAELDKMSISNQSPPPSTPPPRPQSKIPHSQARLRRIALGVLFGSLAGFLLSLAFLYAIRVAIHAKNVPAIIKGPVCFTPQISPKNLQCTLPTAQPLAHGPHGKYYKLVLDNDLTVAVKRLEAASRPEASPSVSSGSKSDMRRVQRQLEVLARVRHQNVMSLKAYVREADRLSLVYDFVPGGSLEDVMKRVRSQQLNVNWDTRNRIAVGVAKGLRYLHFEYGPRMHCNLKPSNVMLDEGFEPRLADCGVARLIASGSADPESSSSLYTAPECYQSSRYTDKSDVYGFGMVLGVLLTGRDPTDPFFSGETGRGSLARWLRHMQQSGDAKEALDGSMLGEEGEEEEMLMAVRVAIVCLSDLPSDRPSSDELVAMLTQLHSL